MRINDNRIRNRVLYALVGILLVAACAATTPGEDGEESAPTKVSAPAKVSRSGSEMWAERCSQCHNLRSPASLSDAQWNAAVTHMRIRAYLTGEEEAKIRAFLQAGN